MNRLSTLLLLALTCGAMATPPNVILIISDDQHEERNFAAAEPARVAALRSKLDAWWPGRPE